MSDKDKNKVKLLATITKEQDEILQEIKQKQGQDKSWTVQKALDEYFERIGRKKKPPRKRGALS